MIGFGHKDMGPMCCPSVSNIKFPGASRQVVAVRVPSDEGDCQAAVEPGDAGSVDDDADISARRAVQSVPGRAMLRIILGHRRVPRHRVCRHFRGGRAVRHKVHLALLLLRGNDPGIHEGASIYKEIINFFNFLYFALLELQPCPLLLRSVRDRPSPGRLAHHARGLQEVPARVPHLQRPPAQGAAELAQVRQPRRAKVFPSAVSGVPGAGQRLLFQQAGRSAGVCQV
jgi:hypothetical protein